MGHVDVAKVTHTLPDGRVLLDEVSFRVADGAKVALVGANGAGKTTLLRLVSGDLDPQEGAITRSGGLGVMRQFVGQVRDESTVRDLLVSVSPPRVMVSTDIGNINSVANSYLRFEEPRSFFAPMSFGNCGYSLPTMIGAKLAALPKEDVRQLYYETAVAPEGNSALESFLLDALK